MPDACGARNGYQPLRCGLEQHRSQLKGPTGKLASRANVAKLASRANVYKDVKGFDKVRLPSPGLVKSFSEIQNLKKGSKSPNLHSTKYTNLLAYYFRSRGRNQFLNWFPISSYAGSTAGHSCFI